MGSAGGIARWVSHTWTTRSAPERALPSSTPVSALTRPLDILEDAIADARDLGTLCVCAAGNAGGAVLWPARAVDAVAVAALGRHSEYPGQTVALHSVPAVDRHDAGNGFRFASFSCHGQEV